MTAAEIADSRTTLAESDAETSGLNPYTVTVARGVTEHAAHIDDLISAHLQGWTLERLPAVDRAILRVAVWELLHAEDVPEPVAVDEAVELAKKLSTDDSPASSTEYWARSCSSPRRSVRPPPPCGPRTAPDGCAAGLGAVHDRGRGGSGSICVTPISRSTNSVRWWTSRRSSPSSCPAG